MVASQNFHYSSKPQTDQCKKIFYKIRKNPFFCLHSVFAYFRHYRDFLNFGTRFYARDKGRNVVILLRKLKTFLPSTRT